MGLGSSHESAPAAEAPSPSVEAGTDAAPPRAGEAADAASPAAEAERANAASSAASGAGAGAAAPAGEAEPAGAADLAATCPPMDAAAQAVATGAQKIKRKRAPPSGRDLSPNMVCPLPCSAPEESPPRATLGLCGPSELSGMSRTRVRLADRSFDLPQMPKPEARLELLRKKLLYLTKLEGAAILKPRAGRIDLAEYILTFLEEGRPLVNTQTGGLMYSDSGSANVDLFFQSVPQPEPKDNSELRQLLEDAWKECPDTCLRQIFHLGANKQGKQDRFSFYDAMLWLWHEQPATFLANLHLVPEANYWKGLCELLARICEGPQRSLERDRALHEAFKEHRPRLLLKDALGCNCSASVAWKPGSRLELAREALKRYDEDPVYRVFFERTGQLFAEQLRSDIAAMNAGRRVGLCAKWCPLLYHSFDRRTLICESIARWLYPAWLPEFSGMTERQYAYQARDKLRKVLSRLKEYIKSPERLMCQQRWDEINYNRVPATAMKIHTSIFEKHDGERFQRYLDDLASGKKKAKTGALMPYELLHAVKNGTQAEKDVAQAQWEALVEQVRSNGQNSEVIAVCDVSGSMSCPATAKVSCMDVAISLSLLLAKVATGPYAGKLITFHEDPTIQTLPGTDNLASLDDFARRMPWGGSTNFYKIFNLLKPMNPKPKRVIVFSDMQFSASGDTANTDLENARREWGENLPELVFWNLSKHKGSPALATDQGVALVSGFSAQILKLLLEEGVFDPLRMLCKAIDKPFLRKPRIVYGVEDAMACVGGPVQPEHPRVHDDSGPIKSTKNLQETSRSHKRLAWSQESLVLCQFPSKEHIAAFIDKKGSRIKSLRETLEKLMCDQLEIKRGQLRFWLDVKTKSAPPPALETGKLVATVKCRRKAQELVAALNSAILGCEPLEGACVYAEARASKEKPAKWLRRRRRTNAAAGASSIMAEEEQERRRADWEAKHFADVKHKHKGKKQPLKHRDKQRHQLDMLPGLAKQKMLHGASYQQQEHRSRVAAERKAGGGKQQLEDA